LLMMAQNLKKKGGAEVGAYEAVNDNTYLQDQFITVTTLFLFVR